MFFYNCQVFGFRAMNEHVNLMVEQYEFAKDKEGEFLTFHEVVRMFKVVFNKGKLTSKNIF